MQLDQRTASVIFRSYQERLEHLVNNGATEIISTLRHEDNQITLSIFDDLNLCFIDESRSIEEVAIRERVLTINGSLQFSCSEEDGNSCIISIPYDQHLQKTSTARA